MREQLGKVKLKELTAGDVQQTLDVLATRLSTRSLQIIRNCLERAIRHAEVRDLVGQNVAALVKAPVGRPGRPSYAPSWDMPPSGQGRPRRAAAAMTARVRASS